MASEEASLRALESLMTEFFHNCTTNERKREIEELLNNFAQQIGAWRFCLYFLSSTRNDYVMMYSLTVFENLINKMWLGVPSQDKMEIRSCLPKLLLAHHKTLPYFIRNKLCKVIVDIGRQDWPMFYHDFFTNILQLIQSPVTTPLGLIMLKTTSEELACPREDLSVARKEELRKLLLDQVQTVLGLLTGILESIWDKHSVTAATPPPSPTHKDERSQRRCTESEFIALKKDADCFFLNKAELEAKVESLKEKVEFLRTFYKEERHQLRAHISDTSVVMQMDNRRDLNLDGTIADVKAQYEDIARRSRAEAQAWYESKFEELRVTAGRNADSLRDSKNTIAELTRRVQRLNGEVRSAKDQRCKLEDAVADAEQCGETTIKDAKHKLSELETALQQAKADLSRHLCEYQELMNIKLALDIEIVTYRKLLEGEESRLCAEGGFPISIPICHSQRGLTYSPEPGFASAQASADRNRSSSAGVCGAAVSCSAGVGSRSARSSYTKAVSVTKSARSNV